TGRGKRLMDDIRRQCAEIERVASSNAAEYAARSAASEFNLSLIATGGATLLFFFLAVAALTIFRGMRRRDDLYQQAFLREQLLKTTLAGIADGVIATDQDGLVTFINPVAQQLTGRDEAEAVGAPIASVFPIVHETTRAKVDNPLE